jgi:hypothetical protein
MEGRSVTEEQADKLISLVQFLAGVSIGAFVALVVILACVVAGRGRR